MLNIRVYPAVPQGAVFAPPSKSAAHRALICAALTGGGCRVFPVADSHDMDATLGVLHAMGAEFERTGQAVTFTCVPRTGAHAVLNCIESGSTLRFLLPVAAVLGLEAVFTGEGRLPERPLGILTEQMKAHGITFSSDRMPFTIQGRLTGGRYELPGDVSSQFISGLLFALPLAETDSEIVLTSPLQSAGYVDMTLAALKQSGIKIDTHPNGYHIAGGQSYRMANELHAGGKAVEGDWSNCAFWLCAGTLNGVVRVGGLDAESIQGDRAIATIIHAFGGAIRTQDRTITVSRSELRGCRIDAAPIPDLVPIIAVMAALSSGDTEIYNAARLRIKESDRLASVSAMLRALGGSVEEYSNRLVIHGGTLRGGVVDGCNDHRIVMSAAVAALSCTEPVVICGAQAVNKSYPNFFDDLIKLGGRYDVIDLG